MECLLEDDSKQPWRFKGYTNVNRKVALITLLSPVVIRVIKSTAILEVCDYSQRIFRFQNEVWSLSSGIQASKILLSVMSISLEKGYDFLYINDGTKGW